LSVTQLRLAPPVARHIGDCCECLARRSTTLLGYVGELIDPPAPPQKPVLRVPVEVDAA
jgi:hypothetical protein